MTAIVTHAEVKELVSMEVTCEASDLELLFVDWLNTIIYEMAVRNMLFGRFAVSIERTRLQATLWVKLLMWRGMRPPANRRARPIRRYS